MSALAHDVEGAGPDLLLVHAGVADRRMWDPLSALLRDRFRIVRPDLRGFGDSVPDPAAPPPHEELAQLIDALGLEAPVVCGASYGGRVALELAAARPELVARLVLLAPGLPAHDWSPRARAFFAAEEEVLEAGRVDEAVELNVQIWAGGASPEAQQLVREMQRRAFELQLGEEEHEDEPEPLALAAVTMPVTIAYGDRDLEDFRDIAEGLHAALPQSELHTIAGAGHLIALEQPEAAAALILG